MHTTFDELETRRKIVRRKLHAELREHSLTWKGCGAVCGLSGGIIACLFGSLLTVSTWFTGAAGYGSRLHTLGTILLSLTIPLLICGAHCLDLMEKQEAALSDKHIQEEHKS
jgi:hypothetical protein